MTHWATKICKINFDMIWYTVIFATNLYFSIFVCSSDILNFVFMNVVISTEPTEYVLMINELPRFLHSSKMLQKLACQVWNQKDNSNMHNHILTILRLIPQRIVDNKQGPDSFSRFKGSRSQSLQKTNHLIARPLS